MSYSAESPPPPQALDIGRCVDDAIAVYKRNWPVLAIAALVVSLLTAASLLILAGPLAGGVCLMSLRAFERDDRRVDLGDLFRCFDRFWPLVGLFFLTLIAVAIGMMLCIVPGVMLATFWLYSFYLVVDRRQGVFEALSASKEIVSRKGFLMNLALLVIATAIEIAPNSIPRIGVLVGWFVSPIAWLILTSGYIQLVREDRGALDDLFPQQPLPVDAPG